MRRMKGALVICGLFVTAAVSTPSIEESRAAGTQGTHADETFTLSCVVTAAGSPPQYTWTSGAGYQMVFKIDPKQSGVLQQDGENSSTMTVTAAQVVIDTTRGGAQQASTHMTINRLDGSFVITGKFFGGRDWFNMLDAGTCTKVDESKRAF